MRTFNEKLFLKINGYAGTHAWLDRLMIFSARWLIGIIFLVVVGYFLFDIFLIAGSWSTFFEMIFRDDVGILVAILGMYYGGPLFIGLLCNWFLGLLTRWPRPVVQFKDKSFQLIHVLQNFKTFPSDHTMVSWSLFFTSIFFFFNDFITIDSLWWSVIILPFLGVSATLISIARIYCGVHYPRDVFAGFIMAFVVNFLVVYLATIWILNHVRVIT